MSTKILSLAFLALCFFVMWDTTGASYAAKRHPQQMYCDAEYGKLTFFICFRLSIAAFEKGLYIPLS